MAETDSIAIQRLIEAARTALAAVAPIAETIGVQWREPENYEEWDTLAKGVFDGFVLQTIQSAERCGEGLPLVQYDKRLSDYRDVSFVAVVSDGRLFPIVCFETDREPFDSLLLADIDQQSRLVRYERVRIDEEEIVAAIRMSVGSDPLRINTIPG